tara:strand:+ start:1063 stop:1200 length:138 start_codon:yes stop_codon:yes gene_type:complete
MARIKTVKVCDNNGGFIIINECDKTESHKIYKEPVKRKRKPKEEE